MSDERAISADAIFDGQAWHEDAALILREGKVDRLVARGTVPDGIERVDLKGGYLAPGFIDLQVNGAAGLMLNDHPSVETIETICRTHARYGTTAVLPTLITDTPETTRAVLAAGAEATQRAVPGFLGLHLEGPHLSKPRKGAHAPALIRPMTDTDLAELIAARNLLPNLLTTVAVESVRPDQIEALCLAGIIVSLGHTDASHEAAATAADAGASMVTHLFNAMSQIGNREPGLAGTALDDPRLYAGLIADGIHVDRATIGIALRAKQGEGTIFLVSDAMAPFGSDITSFTLNGRTIHRRNGRLTLEDGTLAGADLDLPSAVRFMHERLGVPLPRALNMASLYPARAMGRDGEYGHLGKGARADMVHLGDDFSVRGTWIGGERVK
jgi:N-acetylglucosamine-6-phosphate deacetylase